MRLTQYKAAERAIAAADNSGIRERWIYGLRLLLDPAMTTPGGNFRHGALAKLITPRSGERELQYRLKCARTYQQESQIRNAVADLETWHDLTAAGFPEYPRVPGEPDADPRTAREKIKAVLDDLDGDDAEGTLDGGAWDAWKRPRQKNPDMTLEDCERYARACAAKTAGYAEYDEMRFARLEALVKAVGGDKTRLLVEAEEALEASDGASGA